MTKSYCSCLFGILIMVLFYRSQIPMRNYEFWPMLVLLYCSVKFFSEYILDVKYGIEREDSMNETISICLLVIWGLCSQIYYKAGLLQEAVFNTVIFFSLLSTYMVAKFFSSK